MRLMLFILALSLAACGCGPLVNTGATPEDRQQLLEHALDATVVIGHRTSAMVGPGTDTPDDYQFHCTGVVVGQVIVTAAHCTTRGDGDIGVAFRAHDFTWIPARTIFVNEDQDIAIVQLPRGLPRGVRLAHEPPMYGDTVVAIGHSYGLFWSYYIGHVTFPMRENGGVAGKQTWTQHDADVGPGGSGGPVLNTRGELMCITSFVIANQEGCVHLSQIELALQGVGIDPETLR